MPNNLLKEFEQYQSELEEEILNGIRSGWYILGKKLESFEQQFADYIGTEYSVGVASGLDSLSIGMKSTGIGEGDEVIVQANTFIASVMGITINGAIPVFVESDEYYGIDAEKIEEKITERTKAVLVVHLYGIPCQMDKIKSVCDKHNLLLIEDCAQSHGAKFKGQKTGTFGNVGCFSFYPTKNLGAFGDGGAITLNDEGLNKKIRIYRNYGSQEHYKNELVGVNSRLDEIQAGLLSVKLRHLDEINGERRDIARKYNEGIYNPKIKLPRERPGTYCVYHQYVIRTEDKEMRAKLMDYLNDRGIGTIIHYPIPPHLSEAYAYLGYKKGSFPITESFADTVLSIPMYNGYTEEEQEYVIKEINHF